MTNRLNNQENDLGMYERELRDQARELAKVYGKGATEGRVPVRVDHKTVIFKKKIE